MHIIFYGNITSHENMGSVGNVSIAGNKMITNLLKHLCEREDVDIDVVSFYCYKPFPYCKKLFIKEKFETMFKGRLKVWQIGYLNIQFVRQIFLPLRIYHKTKQLLKGNDIIFAFDIYPTSGIPLTMMRKAVKGRTLCLLADLSLGGIHKLTGIRKILRKIYDRRTIKDIKKCNYFILLNENVARLYAPHAKFIVMDGGVEPSEFNGSDNGWNGLAKNIVYTGALVDYSGIMNLVAAMDKVYDKDVVLDIFGDGILRDKIIEISHQNPRVRYHGVVSNEKAIKAQQTAWLLANPRPTETHIAQVTFPSKIFEYMMSGRPVLSTRLNGFSKDYDELLFWIEDNTVESIAAKINQIALDYSSEELNAKSQKSREYLLKNKTWDKNASVVYEFLKMIYDECK